MIIPIFLGVLCSRYSDTKRTALIAAAGIGFLISIISGLHILPLAYPLYAIVTHTTHTSYGLFYNIEAYLFYSGWRIWSGGVIDVIWLSPLIPLLFIPAGVIGCLLGVHFSWSRVHRFPTEVWPQEKPDR